MMWLHNELGAGYLYERNDHITEIRIEDHQRVGDILTKLKPYIRFKKNQVDLILKAIILAKKGIKTKEYLLAISDLADQISSNNYSSSRRKYTHQYVMQHMSP